MKSVRKTQTPSKTRRRNLSFWSIFGADRRAASSPPPLRGAFSIFKESGRTFGGHYRLGEQWKLNMNNGRGSCRDKHDVPRTNSWPMMHAPANPNPEPRSPRGIVGMQDPGRDIQTRVQELWHGASFSCLLFLIHYIHSFMLFSPSYSRMNMHTRIQKQQSRCFHLYILKISVTFNKKDILQNVKKLYYVLNTVNIQIGIVLGKLLSTFYF